MRRDFPAASTTAAIRFAEVARNRCTSASVGCSIRVDGDAQPQDFVHRSGVLLPKGGLSVPTASMFSNLSAAISAATSLTMTAKTTAKVNPICAARITYGLPFA
jgi:hypothetical protein